MNRLSLDRLLPAAERALTMGIPAICLFPYTAQELRTEDCAEAWNPDNLTNRAIRMLKAELPELMVMTDIALDPYNANGHDGFVVDGQIVNDETVGSAGQDGAGTGRRGRRHSWPVRHDGRAHRRAAGGDGSAGHRDVTILSYAAKFASGFYGPFRDAVGAGTRLVGDKATYQINPANREEALACVARDLAEGADMVMVKPGMPYWTFAARSKTASSARPSPTRCRANTRC